jgi:cation diffusion facilitator family transporter
LPSGSVLASIAGAGGMAVAKFAAASFSGSSAMFADGARSAVGCANAGLMALGQKRSRKPADDLHPFGYGMELYFWTLIVAATLFVVGGVATVGKGVYGILYPAELTNVGWSYAVLAAAAGFAGYGWHKAWREFQAGRGDRTFRQAVKKAKDPTTLTVLFDGTASLVGLAVAFLGIFLGKWFGLPALDGVASVVIGLLMAATTAGLVYQSKQLLVGESATAELKAAIRERIEGDETVEGIGELLTMQLAPREVLVAGTVRFRGGLSAAEAAEAVGRVEGGLRAAHPEVKRVFLEPARP